MTIETPRLHLVALTHNDLLLLQQGRNVLERAKGWALSDQDIAPDYLRELQGAMPYWLNGTAANPDRYTWFTAWEILRKDDLLPVGGIGFLFPNNEGVTFTGYHIDRKFWGRGFASEALAAMLAWGFTEPALQCVMANTHLPNMASQQVLRRNGFVPARETTEDGLPVLQWQLTRQAYVSKQ